MFDNVAVLAACGAGLFVGCLLGVFVMSLLQMARRTEELYERRIGTVGVVASDGGDDVRADSCER